MENELNGWGAQMKNIARVKTCHKIGGLSQARRDAKRRVALFLRGDSHRRGLIFDGGEVAHAHEGELIKLNVAFEGVEYLL